MFEKKVRQSLLALALLSSTTRADTGDVQIDIVFPANGTTYNLNISPFPIVLNVKNESPKVNETVVRFEWQLWQYAPEAGEDVSNEDLGFNFTSGTDLDGTFVDLMWPKSFGDNNAPFVFGGDAFRLDVALMVKDRCHSGFEETRQNKSIFFDVRETGLFPDLSSPTTCPTPLLAMSPVTGLPSNESCAGQRNISRPVGACVPSGSQALATNVTLAVADFLCFAPDIDKKDDWDGRQNMTWPNGSEVTSCTLLYGNTGHRTKALAMVTTMIVGVSIGLILHFI